ncbi:hypothetical protein [Gemmobacter sp. 24YEA27]|uniref:hypothetical protein n=1 Tax=Gemmobacter sp. 24YEA27 TaxID=3040672 RepID=UPI0024B3BDC8|nr:hypothetical protein [Gemmobacter sp. 24YEA27]
MADKPVLFSGPMVRALLEGRKTQTRRVAMSADEIARGPWTGATRLHETAGWQVRLATFNSWQKIPVRYAVGDRLYVREAHAILPRTAYRMSIGTGTIDQREHPTDDYSAAVFREGFDRSGQPKWRPGIHMPRWASRITLLVTEVRVERLQDCSEADALAEGVDDRDPVCGYSELWDQINGPGAWDLNPWVAAYTFTVQRQNIDQIGATP